METMYLYEELREVPENAKNTIKGGRLKGFTDINPMWRLKRLTETFGPCGFGWYITDVKLNSEQAGNEIVTTVCLNLYVKDPKTGEWSKPIFGTGGSKILQKENKDFYTNDEGYKMALTDAIGVACKSLGMAADVYWSNDRTKYIQKKEEPEDKPEEKTENMYISPVKAQALRSKCEAAGVSIAKLTELYNVDNFENLAENQHAHIIRNWDRLAEKCKLSEE